MILEPSGVWWAAQLAPFLVFFCVWGVVVAFLRGSGKKDPLFLFFFSLFFFYLCAVLDVTLFQFQALLLLKPWIPGLILNGLAPGKELNLVPLISLTAADLKTSALNILMMVPFGFGLPFLSRLKFAPTVLGGFLLSLTIEILQLTTGLLAGTSFRIADVNDLFFNTLGVAVGYALLGGALNVFLPLVDRGPLKDHPLVRYLVHLRQDGAPGRNMTRETTGPLH